MRESKEKSGIYLYSLKHRLECIVFYIPVLSINENANRLKIKAETLYGMFGLLEELGIYKRQIFKGYRSYLLTKKGIQFHLNIYQVLEVLDSVEKDYISDEGSRKGIARRSGETKQHDLERLYKDGTVK